MLDMDKNMIYIYKILLILFYKCFQAIRILNNNNQSKFYQVKIQKMNQILMKNLIMMDSLQLVLIKQMKIILKLFIKITMNIPENFNSIKKMDMENTDIIIMIYIKVVLIYSLGYF